MAARSAGSAREGTLVGCVGEYYVLYQLYRRALLPMYQRPYVWTADRQWQPLIEDLCRVDDTLLRESVAGVVGNRTPEERTPPHFLGAVVVDQERHFVGSAIVG